MKSIVVASLALVGMAMPATAIWKPPMELKFQIMLNTPLSDTASVPEVSRLAARGTVWSHKRHMYHSSCSGQGRGQYQDDTDDAGGDTDAHQPTSDDDDSDVGSEATSPAGSSSKAESSKAASTVLPSDSSAVTDLPSSTGSKNSTDSPASTSTTTKYSSRTVRSTITAGSSTSADGSSSTVTSSKPTASSAKSSSSVSKSSTTSAKSTTSSKSTDSASPTDSGSVSTKSDIGVFDIDLFDNSAEAIKQLQSQGKKVICYFSAGTYEPYRTDSSEFTSDDMGGVLADWPDEKWVKLSSSNVRSIMLKRLDLAVTKGCDAVDPDNMDGYTFTDNNAGLTKSNTIEFLKFLSAEAHSRDLAFGLKNALEVITDVLDDIDFAVNEECSTYNECTMYAPLLDAGKPVLHIEYPSGAPSLSASDVTAVCEGSRKGFTSGQLVGFNTILKTYDLDGWAAYCDGTELKMR